MKDFRNPYLVFLCEIPYVLYPSASYLGNVHKPACSGVFDQISKNPVIKDFCDPAHNILVQFRKVHSNALTGFILSLIFPAPVSASSWLQTMHFTGVEAREYTVCSLLHEGHFTLMNLFPAFGASSVFLLIFSPHSFVFASFLETRRLATLCGTSAVCPTAYGPYSFMSAPIKGCTSERIVSEIILKSERSLPILPFSFSVPSLFSFPSVNIPSRRAWCACSISSRARIEFLAFETENSLSDFKYRAFSLSINSASAS